MSDSISNNNYHFPTPRHYVASSATVHAHIDRTLRFSHSVSAIDPYYNTAFSGSLATWLLVVDVLNSPASFTFEGDYSDFLSGSSSISTTNGLVDITYDSSIDADPHYITSITVTGTLAPGRYNIRLVAVADRVNESSSQSIEIVPEVGPLVLIAVGLAVCLGLQRFLLAKLS